MTWTWGEQIDLFAPATSCGKMSRAHFQVPEETEKAKTLPPLSRRSSKSQNRPPMCVCVFQVEDGQSPGATTLRMENGQLLGEYATHSFGDRPSSLMEECSQGEHRNGVEESHLSQILEVSPHPRFYLSEKACRGYLVRVERHGRPLPKEFKEALESQIEIATGEPKGDVYSFDQGACRYAGITFKNISKTICPGTCPGDHDAVYYQVSDPQSAGGA